jgi:hypothetical protein
LASLLIFSIGDIFTKIWRFYENINILDAFRFINLCGLLSVFS